jgi:protein SCO1/2
MLRKIGTWLRKNPTVLPLGTLALVLILGAVMLYGGGAGKPAPAVSEDGPVAIGGPFRLTGPDGQTVTEKSFPGKWTLVFFGYTFCPDVCPTTMIDIAKALELLGPRAESIQPLFITVDPKRDTPAVLKGYIANFDKRIMGLSGSPEAVADTLKAYRVYAAERTDTSGGPALFDHSAIIYLMKPSGAYAAFFTAGISGQDLAQGIGKAMDEKGEKE